MINVSALILAFKICLILFAINSDVYTPVTGTVTAVNEELADNPGLVNE